MILRYIPRKKDGLLDSLASMLYGNGSVPELLCQAVEINLRQGKNGLKN